MREVLAALRGPSEAMLAAVADRKPWIGHPEARPESVDRYHRGVRAAAAADLATLVDAFAREHGIDLAAVHATGPGPELDDAAHQPERTRTPAGGSMTDLDLSSPSERALARQAASGPDRTLLADMLLAAVDLLDRIPADVLSYAAKLLADDRKAGEPRRRVRRPHAAYQGRRGMSDLAERVARLADPSLWQLIDHETRGGTPPQDAMACRQRQRSLARAAEIVREVLAALRGWNRDGAPDTATLGDEREVAAFLDAFAREHGIDQPADAHQPEPDERAILAAQDRVLAEARDREQGEEP
jgi:hypothetical protein